MTGRPLAMRREPVVWMGILLLLALVVGVVIAPDYGVSTDEPDNARVGVDARQAYAGGEAYFSREALAEHGPVYFMIFTAASEQLQRLVPAWPLQVGRHLTNYVTFLLGVSFFYLLCLRFMRPPFALAASALYLTQPILFGAAFINQKDIPFLTCFLGVVALGWAAADGGREAREAGDVDGSRETGRTSAASQVRSAWAGVPGRTRWAVAAGGVLGLWLVVDVIGVGGLERAAAALVTLMYEGRAPWPMQQLFALVATDAYKTPLDLYLAKLSNGFDLLAYAAPGFGLLAVLGVAWSWLPPVRRFLAGRWSWRRLPLLIASGILLGAAIAIRQIGVFAGALVSVSLLWQARGRGVVPLLLYWSCAALVMYATWPYLWLEPISRYLASFTAIHDFSAHRVLFEGVRYGAGQAPWSFLPVMLGLQLTEPVFPLMAVGLLAFVFGKPGRGSVWVPIALLVIWLLLPLIWVVVDRVPIYHNLRHMLFVLPPIFVVGGVGMDVLASRLRPGWLTPGLIGMALLPGLIALVGLHPYQYAYFNFLAGGIGGAAGRFETDYWCTSLKETTEYVNEVAAPGATLMVFGPIGNALPYIREDLAVEGQYSPLTKADIVALCPHGLSQRWDPADFQLVHEVRKGEAVLGQVWRRVRPAGEAEPAG